MKRDPDDHVAVDVELPTAMIDDLDAYAVSNGYQSIDAVVARAIEQHAQ